MSAKIRVRTAMLHHSGGTKFYEIVMLTNVNDGASVVLNRWGKMSDQEAGGQTKHEKFSGVGDADKAFASKETEKSKRGYARASAVHGLHPHDGKPAIHSDSKFDAYVTAHFGYGMVDTIRSGLNLPKQSAAPAEPKKQPEPEVHIDRGNDWGAWA